MVVTRPCVQKPGRAQQDDDKDDGLHGFFL
jgi:hypothetical protein